jgi:hypothetical protein
MALLIAAHSETDRVAGVLVDVSDDGFRARHSSAGFQPSDTVSFIHPLREGTARVVWTRQAGQDFETGFEYLSIAPTR